MKTDFENGIRKTIDLSVHTEKMTADVLKACMKEFLDNKAERKGEISLRQLQEKYSCKLENISVSDDNIRDFLSVAKKYDIDFALKRDSNHDPPAWHVFFSASRTEDFKRAFTEYASGKQNTAEKDERGNFTREKLKREAADVSKKQQKERTRQKSREASL